MRGLSLSHLFYALCFLFAIVCTFVSCDNPNGIRKKGSKHLKVRPLHKKKGAAKKLREHAASRQLIASNGYQFNGNANGDAKAANGTVSHMFTANATINSNGGNAYASAMSEGSGSGLVISQQANSNAGSPFPYGVGVPPYPVY